MTPSLYDIRRNYVELLNLDLEPEIIKSTLESLDDAFEDKAVNITLVMKENESTVNFIDQEIKRLQDRKALITKRNNQLKEYLLGSMIATNKKKIETDLFTISWKKNPPAVTVLDPDMIDPKYVRTKISKEINKVEIKKELTAGMVVAGAILTQSESLVIK